MGSVKSLVVLSALALLAMSCAPRHPCPYAHGGPCKEKAAMAMTYGCGPEACTYRSRCFSSGAVRSNDGVCQECSGGKWVGATGCSECGGRMPCGGKMPCGKQLPPCGYMHEHHRH